uniref:Uncharacterized protein n=1 Tax=Phytophthora ramorum TaxID=164328 RepID=H3GRT3_PHYRM
MQAVDPPPDNPAEVIDVSTPSPPSSEDAQGEQTAGVKRHQDLTEIEGEVGDSETDKEMPPALEEDEESQDDLTYEEIVEEPLTFGETYLYLHEELAGKNIQEAKETMSAMEYIENMFMTVFKTHPSLDLTEDKRRYPTLNEEEKEQLLNLFLMDSTIGRADARKWRARLYDITRSLYKHAPDLPPFPARRKKDVPSRLLVQSTLPDADRLMTERAAAEEKKRRADIVARRRQRVADIRSGKNIPPFPAPYQAAFEALRAERIALEKKKAVEGQLESLGRTMRTRASDAKLQKNEEAENALGEVMQQLDAEDKEGEPSDSGDSDYEDEGAGAARPAKTSKGIVLRGNADEDSVESEGVDDSDEDAETEAGSSSGKDAEEMEVSSSNEESASGVAQKRNRKGHRKSPRKAARTATTLSPRDGSDAEDGAFVEGFPCRWPSWEDFHRAFEEFQGATY